MKIIKVIVKGIGWIAVAAVTVVLSIIFGIDYLMERLDSHVVDDVLESTISNGQTARTTFSKL